MGTYRSSELIVNPDGSIFHLKLKPDQIPDRIILVGDPGRVKLAASHLTHPKEVASNREFVSYSGIYNGNEILILSTGIGTDNMDIVVNELDALVNIDLITREEKTIKRPLKLIRIGTSGSLQADIPVATRMAASWSVGLDGLMKYYARPHLPERIDLEQKLNQYLSAAEGFPGIYAAISGGIFRDLFSTGCEWGITVAAHGFYGPQGREIRAPLAFPGLNELFRNFRYKDQRITNFEMESSALYGLSEILGHQALTICLIIANRARGEYIGDYQPEMSELIRYVLETIP